MQNWFGKTPVEAYRRKTDYLLIFEHQEDIANMVPDLSALEKRTEVRGVIVSAKGDSVDFVSRFFAPQSGIHEDPATGSAHTTLTPYWSERLGKRELSALQLSKRKGYLNCKNEGARIKISGRAKSFFTGRIFLD